MAGVRAGVVGREAVVPLRRENLSTRTASNLTLARLQRSAGNRALAARVRGCRAADGAIQRIVAIAYGANTASATITTADIGTGTAPTVAANAIPSHAVTLGLGAGHPYHHERGHLIGRRLGGPGNVANNFVGLSDGTNAPLMYDIEGTLADGLAAQAGSSVWIEVTVDYTAGDYNGPVIAPHAAGMVGSLTYDVYDHAPPHNTRILHHGYPNGVVKNHPTLGCC